MDIKEKKKQYILADAPKRDKEDILSVYRKKLDDIPIINDNPKKEKVLTKYFRRK